MAGETRGELAEAIAKVALEIALAQSDIDERVYWEELPEGLVIKPDLTIGLNKDNPTNLFLINASESVGNSNMKYWRNIGEIFDIHARLANPPSIHNLVFKSEIKPELIKLTAVLCDSTHNVDLDEIHGYNISIWLEENHSKVPSQKIQKENFIKAAISENSPHFNPIFFQSLKSLSNLLASRLYTKKADLIELWELISKDFKQRKEIPSRTSRTTLLRRGLSRWLVFDENIRRKILHTHLSGSLINKDEIPEYATSLGLLNMRLGGGFISSTESRDANMVSSASYDLGLASDFYIKASDNDVDKACDALCKALEQTPQEMLVAANLLRNMPERVYRWHQYVIDNWNYITTPIGCYQVLMQCNIDPTMEGKVGSQDENRNWLYDHLIAILRAYYNRDNDFGYSKLVSYFKSNQNDNELQYLFQQILLNLDAKIVKNARKWIEKTLPSKAEPGRRGFQDWLAGTKNVSPVIIGAFAFSLARLLSNINNHRNILIEKLIEKHAYSLWNRLLTHQDFEPLLDLIQLACNNLVEYKLVPTIMADLAEKAVQDMGYIPVLAFQGGLIYWQSVTDSGKSHKRKELSGRARALRFQKTSNGFSKRSDVDKLILVIDGTFDDKDIKVLTESGWDAVFYADEMDQLIQFINSLNFKNM